MAEIRLICPDCGTEYQIPETAVPDGGRDVECSECGRIWHAAPAAAAIHPMEMGVYSYNFAEFKGLSTPNSAPPAEAEPAPEPAPEPVAEHEAQSETVTTSQPASGSATPSVPLKRRLPENVLNILLEEVEHERQARQAESSRDANQEPDPVTAQAGDALEEPDWPATTVIGKRRVQIPEAPVAKAAPISEPEPAEVLPQAAITPKPDVVIAAKPMNTLPVLAASQPKNDYWQGVGTAAAIAAILVAIYVIAPSGAPDGLLGDIRHGLDQARLWLQNAADGPQS